MAQNFGIALVCLAPLALVSFAVIAWAISPLKVTRARAIVYGICLTCIGYSAAGLAAIGFHNAFPGPYHTDEPDWMRLAAATGFLTAFIGAVLSTNGRGLSRLSAIPAGLLATILCLGAALAES
jgi:hypothetical protein